MGKPNAPCFDKNAIYLTSIPASLDFPTIRDESIPILDLYDDQDFFILAVSGISCRSIIFDSNDDDLINSNIDLNQKIQFLCDSDRYDPNLCFLEVNKYIEIANINIQTDRCRRYRIKITNLSFPTTTTTPAPTTTIEPTTPAPTTTSEPTTTTPDPIFGNNSANWEQKANWNNSAYGNTTSVGSNGRSSAYGTYDQSGNISEFIDNASVDSTIFVRGNNFSNYSIDSKSRISRQNTNANWQSPGIGFRVATLSNPLILNNFVFIGDTGNSPDTNGYGKVTYNYRINRYAVTNCEYVNFLNSTDPQGLNPQDLYPQNKFHIQSEYNIEPAINLDPFAPIGKKYSTKINMANKPVNFVSWFSCARYCNWLHNGKKSYKITSFLADAPQNYGAYNIGTITTGNTVLKQNNATYWIPNENEWYKAAYYKGGGSNAGYWSYATQSDTSPIAVRANSSGDGTLNGVIANASDYLCPITTESLWIYPLGYSTNLSGTNVYGSGADWVIQLPESATGLEGGYTILINGNFRRISGSGLDAKWGFNLTSTRIRYQDGTFMDTIAALFCVVTNLPNNSIYKDMTTAQVADFYHSATYIDFFNNHIYYPGNYVTPDHTSTIPTQVFASSSWATNPASSPVFLKSNAVAGRRIINVKFNKPVSNFPMESISLYWSWRGYHAYKPLSYWQANLPAVQYNGLAQNNNFIDDYRNKIANT